MWVCLNNAFISVVLDRDDHDHCTLLVRARREGDIERALGSQGKNIDVQRTPDADYLFRARVAFGDFEKAMCAQIQEITYDNFKNSVEDPDLHDAYMDIWTIMHRVPKRRAPS